MNEWYDMEILSRYLFFAVFHCISLCFSVSSHINNYIIHLISPLSSASKNSAAQ